MKKLQVPGFLAAGLACGIKKDGRRDLALILSETPAVAAGVFTQNQVCSPTVTLSRANLKASRSVQAIVVNSGNANACTGPQGMKDCRTITAEAARALGLKAEEVLIASTGVIGVPLPVAPIREHLPRLANELSPTGWDSAAEAIMTTDLTRKTSAVKFGGGVIAGIAKGSGMIQPNMATMLGFLASDVSIGARDLQRALKAASDRTFNRITVDGETSTNDMVLMLANGHAGGPALRPGTKAFEEFSEALEHVCRKLAFAIVEDGEGVTKFVTTRVRGAKNPGQAEKVARNVANSKLVQTALFGQDPNWGRIICAVGYAGVPLRQDRIEISVNRVPLVKGGVPVPGLSTAQLKKKMKSRTILIDIDLGDGKAEAEVYGGDLTYDYVRINAEYTT